LTSGIWEDFKTFSSDGAATICWSVRLCRNDLVFEKKTFFSYVSGIFSCPLVSYMGYPLEAYFKGFGCGGIATIGANGHSVFLWGIGADLVLELIVIKMSDSFFICLV